MLSFLGGGAKSEYPHFSVPTNPDPLSPFRPPIKAAARWIKPEETISHLFRMFRFTRSIHASKQTACFFNRGKELTD